jgi:hypothetical protein
MMYGRKCFCCERKREQRFFMWINRGETKRLSLVCTDCIEGKTPKGVLRVRPRKFMDSAPTDGLWRGPVSREPMRASL